MSLGLIMGLMCASPARAADSSPDLAALARGNNAFAFDLYGQLRSRDGNIFFSPLSVSSALAMVYGGARGATASQMEKTLHFPARGEQLHQTFLSLMDELNAAESGRGDRLAIANSLWPQKGEPIRDAFIETVEKYYGSAIVPVDFVNDEPTARNQINGWVEKATKEKITNLIAFPLDPMTRLLLVNAVYFKGTWMSPFLREATEDGDFYSGEEKITAPFMGKWEHFNHHAEAGLQVLELPYVDGRTSMLVLLPGKTPGAMKKLEKSLSSERLSQWREKLSSVRVDLSLPRFSITWGAEPLSRHLVALGMSDAFSEKADFSGMTGGEPLSLSDVVHKAFVDVNEEGTEAAAATGAIATAAGFDRPRSIVFRADRPFLFLIQDNPTGSILFMGRVVKPEAK